MKKMILIRESMSCLKRKNKKKGVGTRYGAIDEWTI